MSYYSDLVMPFLILSLLVILTVLLRKLMSVAYIPVHFSVSTPCVMKKFFTQNSSFLFGVRKLTEFDFLFSCMKPFLNFELGFSSEHDGLYCVFEGLRVDPS